MDHSDATAETGAPTASGAEGAAPGNVNGDANGGAYQVLARKYRPDNFSALIGQEAMVRTLTNAIAADRLAHAYILTGVRGIGKTTTARIIARALNCIGPDGTGGPTASPCGKCANCTAIAQDRHVDVMEMDAASRTGVGDIRELIEGVRYRPTSARFKIYIIDEVHMLSTSAFNALLKTLEEPPEHVKFIFATTEIRKVPVTVLSRCQRFDLRRLETDRLADHFKGICAKEGASISEGALYLIARAADGSVRDGLSLLDQAIAMAEGEIQEQLVRDMLGLADRTQCFDLLQSALAGQAPAALKQLGQMYQDGADPAAVLNDLLEVTHLLTKAKLLPDVLDLPGVPEIERTRGKDMSSKLGMAALARAWQILLKGLNEVQTAPSPVQAAEMVLVRLAHAANLPTPEEALRKLQDGGVPAAPAAAPPAPAPPVPARDRAPAPAPAGAGTRAVAGGGGRPAPRPTPQADLDGDPYPQDDDDPGADPDMMGESAPVAAAPPTGPAAISSFADVVALAAQHKEAILQSHLLARVHLVAFEPGRIEFRPAPGAPDSLAGDLGRFLKAATGDRWMVTVSNAQGAPTMAETQAKADADEKAEVAEHPLVKAVMDAFPGAQIKDVRHKGDE